MIDIEQAFMLGQKMGEGSSSKGQLSKLALAFLLMALTGDDHEEQETDPMHEPEVRVVDRAIPLP